MKKIQTLLSGLAFLVTAAVVTAHAEEAAAETNAGLAKLLDFRIAIALFVVVGICLLVSLVIWRMPRSKAKGEKARRVKRSRTKTWKLCGSLTDFGW